jgi:hypothetical protein
VGAFHSLSVEEALLKAAPASPGAGIFFKKSSISTVGASHSLPVEEALLQAAPASPAWAGYTFIGMQINSLQEEIV